MELELIRTYHPMGTNGELFLNGNKVCSTIELPWKQNQPQVSCIPEGRYALKKRYTRRFGHHLHVIDVKGRQWILIHAANDALKEIKGCIAPVSFLTGEGKGTRSRVALAKIVSITDIVFKKKQQVFLTIKAGEKNSSAIQGKNM